MRKRLFYMNPSTEKVEIIIPAYDDSTRTEGLTDEEFFDEATARILAIARLEGHQPESGITYYEMDEDDAPPDRYFRDVWECPSGEIQINMTKARVVHMDKIRVVRNAELVKEDVTFMRAVEDGDTDAQATIKTKKQTLRDIPATFDITTGVDTPEKLKAKWPTELPARE
jgi:hypothetical protein